MPKTAAEYLSLPYSILLRRDPREDIFVAKVQELHGCSAHGATQEDALSKLRDNMLVWIEDCIESGDPVPEPSPELELPSGKWLQRVPRSLHLKLIQLAKEEGVSLNQFVTSALAEAVGNKVIGAYLRLSAAQSCHWSVSGFGKVSSCFDIGSFDVRIDSGEPESMSPTSAIYLQHLAETSGVPMVERPPTKRSLYGYGKKQICAIGS